MNGSSSMNFWRLSAKQFRHFQQGDLLFFIDRKARKGREKGLIGYGKFKHKQALSLTKTWNLYGELNGYQTKQDMREAILKRTKGNRLPASLHSLFLEEVIFFQGPVFLSEFDVHLPSTLESFIYLEDHGNDLTAALLKKAQSIGIDVWTRALNQELNTNILKEDVLIHQLKAIINQSPFQQQKCRFKLPAGARELNHQSGFYLRQRTLYIPILQVGRQQKTEIYAKLGLLEIVRHQLSAEKLSIVFYGPGLTADRSIEQMFSLQMLELREL